MSDPRNFTVKQCAPAYAKSGAAIGNATSTRRDFFNAIGKVGDLNVLNDIGGGRIGKGLRTLASVSNSIRTGTGALPTSIGKTLDSGANWVLETTGIAPTVVQAVGNFHPGIANQAYGQAKQIFQNVKSGSFSFSSIPNALQDLQNLERLGRNIFTPGKNDANTTLSERCEASPYAVDLIARAPKYKFLFVVQFIPEAGYSALSGSDFAPLDMAFTVKKSSRPGVHFIMEDVNFYNFRTKVITKTEFQEMSMSFHDDNMNFATEFYNAYLRAMSPISGLEPGQSVFFEQAGMAFEGNTLVKNNILGAIDGNLYSASSGPLANNVKQVFKEIRLYHLFDWGKKMTVYRFVNPRINALTPDDLDMSVSEGSELSMTFNYDSVYVDTNVTIEKGKSQYNLAETQRGAVYPLRFSNGTDGPSSSGFDPNRPAGVRSYSTGNPLNLINRASATGNTEASGTQSQPANLDRGDAAFETYSPKDLTWDGNPDFSDSGDGSFQDAGTGSSDDFA